MTIYLTIVDFRDMRFSVVAFPVIVMHKLGTVYAMLSRLVEQGFSGANFPKIYIYYRNPVTGSTAITENV